MQRLYCIYYIDLWSIVVEMCHAASVHVVMFFFWFSRRDGRARIYPTDPVFTDPITICKYTHKICFHNLIIKIYFIIHAIHGLKPMATKSVVPLALSYSINFHFFNLSMS